MKTLIPMVEFVKMQENLLTLESYAFFDFYNNVSTYAKFLSQPLELGFFVPCDEDGSVLEEPKWENVDKNALDGVDGKYYSMLHDYQKAKEKVLFEGFRIVICNGENAVYDGKMASISVTEMKNKTIEFLAPYYKPTLTDSAIKQLGL